VSERKGIFEVIDAWKKAAISDGELWIVGDVPRELQARIEAELPANARLFGHRSDPETLLVQCHVQILPSEMEGMAKTLVEGAACGCVTLSTPESGFPIEEGKTGYHISRSDTQAIATRLRELADNPKFLEEMSRNSVAFIESNLTWNAFHKRFIDALTLK